MLEGIPMTTAIVVMVAVLDKLIKLTGGKDEIDDCYETTVYV